MKFTHWDVDVMELGLATQMCSICQKPIYSTRSVFNVLNFCNTVKIE